MVRKRGFEVSWIFLSPISNKTMTLEALLKSGEGKIFVNIPYVRTMIPLGCRNAAPPPVPHQPGHSVYHFLYFFSININPKPRNDHSY